MTLQYTAKLLVPILRARAGLQHRAGLSKNAASSIADSLKQLDSMISSSRTLWRLWGLLPIIQWMISMEKVHPPTRKLHTIERLQGWAMLAYYPLEHTYFLASNKVINLSPKTIAKLARWSVRFWMAYVVLQVLHLREDRRLLHARERVSRNDSSMEERMAIHQRKQAIRNETWVNLGYLPLTVHWSLPNGLFKNELWVGLFGLIAAIGGFRGGWAATAIPVRK